MALNNVIRNSDDPSPRRTLTLAMLFAEAIATISKTNSLGGVPAGHLYAMSAMPAGISLAEFDAAIAVLTLAFVAHRAVTHFMLTVPLTL